MPVRGFECRDKTEMTAMRTSIFSRCFPTAAAVVVAALSFLSSSSAQNVNVPVVRLELVDESATETLSGQNFADWAEFRVTLSRTVSNAVDVYLHTQGTARLGGDFELDRASDGRRVRIPAGLASLNVRLWVIDDAFFEGDESVSINLVPLPPMGIPYYDVDPAHSSVTMVIHDNESATAPLVTIRAAVPETHEPLCDPAICDAPTPAPGVFVVSRSGGDVNQELTVFLRYTGTASSGADYGALPGSVVFGAGVNSVELNVEPTHDTVVEGDETVVAELQADPTLPMEEYRVDPTQAYTRVVIHDNYEPDIPLIMFEGSSVEATEPSIEVPPIALVPIKRIGAAPDLILHFEISGTAIEGVDYLELRREVLYPSAASGLGLYVHALPDLLQENDETVIIKLVQPEGGNSGYRIDPEHDTIVVTIHNSPPPPVSVVRIAATRSATSELDSVPGLFTITRSAPLEGELEVFVAYQGTAKAGEDYLRLPGVVVIPAGRDSLELEVVAWGDWLAEGDETVEAKLSPHPFVHTPRYFVDPDHASAQVVIHNNDPPPPPVVSIHATQWKTAEPNPAAFILPGVFTVRRTGPTNNFLPVRLSVGGTATAGADYNALPEAVTIPAGASSVDVRVFSRHDTLPEGPEVVLARILPSFTGSPANPYVVSAFAGSAMVVISDDDPNHPAGRLDIVQPSEGARLPIGAPVHISAIVVHENTEIGRRVEFYADGTFIGRSDYEAPLRPGIPSFPSLHNFTWSNAPAGRHVLSARVEVLLNNWMQAPPVNIVVGPDPEPEVSIEATDAIAEESSYPYRRLPLRGRFTISRTGPTSNSLPVFVHYGGRATPGADYAPLPWLVTIPAGTNKVELEVVPEVDNLPEPLETVEATLSDCPPQTNPPLGIPCFLTHINPTKSRATVFIRDDGYTMGSLEITAPKDGDRFAEGDTIRIAVTAIDLQGAIKHVDFYDGDRKIGESTIVFIREPDPGTPIHHEFVWRGALSGPHVLTARGNSVDDDETSAPVRITVGGPVVPVVSIRATQPNTAEPCPICLVAPGVFTVSRTGPTDSSLIVQLAARGTATPGSDYAPLPSSVEIPAGTGSVQVLVLPMDDLLMEGDETVIAVLQPDPSLGPIERYHVDPEHSEGTVIILDDERQVPFVSIVATDAFAREGGSSIAGVNTATFVVRRGGETNSNLTVVLDIRGTASNGADYVNVPSEVTIPAGRRSARIVVTPIDDNLRERIETVIIELLHPATPAVIPPIPPTYLAGWPRRAAAIIVDNDLPRPPCLRLSDGLFNLCMPATGVDCVRLEATLDFKEWTPLCTVPVNEGVAHYVDPDAQDSPHKFFRMVPVVCEPEP